MTAIGRPRRIEEETRTYNALYPASLLDEAKKKAEEDGISMPTILRNALEEYLHGKPIGYPVGGTPTPGNSYEDGVDDALDLIKKTSRLRSRISTGQTMGEVIAEQIHKDLLGG